MASLKILLIATLLTSFAQVAEAKKQNKNSHKPKQKTHQQKITVPPINKNEKPSLATIAPGTTETLNVGSDCRMVTNNTQSPLFVPITSTEEWNSFVRNPGKAKLESCTPCRLPWGGTINNGQTVTAYRTDTVDSGSCSSQTRSCNAGTLTGSFRYRSCQLRTCFRLTCTAMSGRTQTLSGLGVPGALVTAYAPSGHGVWILRLGGTGYTVVDSINCWADQHLQLYPDSPPTRRGVGLCRSYGNRYGRRCRGYGTCSYNGGWGNPFRSCTVSRC